MSHKTEDVTANDIVDYPSVPHPGEDEIRNTETILRHIELRQSYTIEQNEAILTGMAEMSKKLDMVLNYIGGISKGIGMLDKMPKGLQSKLMEAIGGGEEDPNGNT